MNKMELTEKEALALYESGFWEDLSLEERAKFQILEPRLCMPFSVYHEAVEKTLGRPVFTYELAMDQGGIKAELFEGKEPPTLTEILNMIPKEKRIALGLFL